MEHHNELLKFAGGLRVSSSKQMLEGDSTDDQLKIISRYAEKHNGVVVKWFEIVQSATKNTLDEQPFKEFIDYCKEHPNTIDCLIVSKIDRFTRGGTAIYDQLKAELLKYNVYVLDAEGVIGNVEIDTLEHLNLKFKYSWAIQNPTRENEIREVENAKIEAQKIARRLIGAEIRYTQNGYWMRKPPYGLKSIEKITESGKRRILIPGDNDEYKYIMLMFELAERGNLTDAQIVAELNIQGYRSRISNKHEPKNPLKIIGHIGGVKLDVEQLRNYLSNPIYAGVICEKWTNNIPIRASFEGIISIEKFNKVNKGRIHIHKDEYGALSIHKGLIAEWRLNKQKDNPEFAYRQYILCPVCKKSLLGSASTGKGRKKRPAYHCAREHKRFGVRKAVFDDLINKFVASIELSDSFKDKFIEKVREEWLKREKEFNSKAININTQLLAIDKQMETELESFSSATSPVVKKMIEDKIDKLQSERILLAENRNIKETEQLDMERVLRNTRYYMEHLPELLMGSDNPIENASFFGLLFATRPTYTELENGTPELSSLFKLNAEYVKSNSSLVTLRGIEPLLPG